MKKRSQEDELLIKNGIYKITNLKTGQFYIGSAAGVGGFKKRWARPYNEYLTRAIKKYGAEAFKFEVLLVCEPEECLANEQKFLDELRPWAETGAGYNICKIAGSTRGLKQSPESNEKRRAANMGKKHTPERRANISAAKKGKPAPEMTAETRAKISAGLIGNKNSVGSKSNLGRKQAPEEIERRRLALIGRLLPPFSEEHKEKLRVANIGRKFSDETRKKLSASQKRRRARERAARLEQEAPNV